MEFHKLNSVMERTSKYCYLADEDDYIEVIEWDSGEGYDVTIYRKNETDKFHLSNGEFNLLSVLIKIEKE